MKRKHPTYTSQVLAELVACQDYISAHELERRLRLGFQRVSAALHHLYQKHAVGVVASEGVLYWFATPEDDQRLRTVDEIADGCTRTRRGGHHKRRRRGELPQRD